MNLKRFGQGLMAICSIGLVIGLTQPAHAATMPNTQQIVLKAHDSTLTIQFKKPVDKATLNKIESAFYKAPASPDAAGPSGGAFLVCNQLHSFADTNGTYTFQHACGGTTGPWGYLLSTYLCTTVNSPVSETGMSWTRNGAAQPRQAPHPGMGCRYQFHGNYNPEHDFDSITYSDDFLFTVDGGGNADLHINGSFYSAPCTNPSVCS
jgi:hypothetical protein